MFNNENSLLLHGLESNRRPFFRVLLEVVSVPQAEQNLVGNRVPVLTASCQHQLTELKHTVLVQLLAMVCAEASTRDHNRSGILVVAPECWRTGQVSGSHLASPFPQVKGSGLQSILLSVYMLKLLHVCEAGAWRHEFVFH